MFVTPTARHRARIESGRPEERLLCGRQCPVHGVEQFGDEPERLFRVEDEFGIGIVDRKDGQMGHTGTALVVVPAGDLDTYGALVGVDGLRLPRVQDAVAVVRVGAGVSADAPRWALRRCWLLGWDVAIAGRSGGVGSVVRATVGLLPRGVALSLAPYGWSSTLTRLQNRGPTAGLLPTTIWPHDRTDHPTTSARHSAPATARDRRRVAVSGCSCHRLLSRRIGHIELGRNVPNKAELIVLARDHYGADTDTLAALENLRTEASKRGWWVSVRAPGMVGRLRRPRARCHVVTLPGAGEHPWPVTNRAVHARSLHPRRAPLSPGSGNLRVPARLKRQDRLIGSNPLELTAVISQGALEPCAAEPSVATGRTPPCEGEQAGRTSSFGCCRSISGCT